MGSRSPRDDNCRPFLATRPFTIWTTIELTISADGSSAQQLAGASPFPRHWLYDDAGHLVQKAALTRAKLWQSTAFGRHTPWGGEDQSPWSRHRRAS